MATNSTARDVFMYLLVVVVLAMSTISLGSLAFDMVNIYLPDPAFAQCWYDSCANGIRTALAVLVVAFPVLVWAWRFLSRDIATNPEKADLLPRRWLLYFTLFVAGIVVISDLIVLINNWLQGELTLPFFVKVISVLVIAGATFYYFLRQLHPERSGYQTLVARGSIAVVLLALIAGFVTAGSPGAARDRRLDDQRIGHLSQIQSQIVNVFWTSKGVLPSNLSDLNDPVSGFMVPTDPETRQSYEYVRNGDLRFTLCAAFTTAITMDPALGDKYPSYAPGMDQSNWDHGTGRVCFERTIDPQLYPVRK